MSGITWCVYPDGDWWIRWGRWAAGLDRRGWQKPWGRNWWLGPFHATRYAFG